MGFSLAAGRLLAGAIAPAILVGACAGQSEFSSGDEAAAGETQGGTGSGGETSGGASPTGGTGTGGSGAVGGIVTGTGGAAPTCRECPPADYALVIEGDGVPYEMRFNGVIDTNSDHAAAICSEEPLRGWVGGCSRGIVLWACEDPMSGPPCLEIDGGMVRYIDHQRGELFSGNVTSDVPSVSVSGIETGTLTLSLTNATGDMLVLTVRYTFCATELTSLRIVC